jgi:hypothetical protein
MISYNNRKIIINNIIYYYRLVTPSFNDIIRYQILFILHLILSSITLLFFIDNKRIRQIIILLGLFIIFTQYLFNGCILSLVEYKLNPNGLSILDPYMNILNIKINNKNRKLFTKIWGFILISSMIIYYILYYYIWK